MNILCTFVEIEIGVKLWTVFHAFFQNVEFLVANVFIRSCNSSFARLQ